VGRSFTALSPYELSPKSRRETEEAPETLQESPWWRGEVETAVRYRALHQANLPEEKVKPPRPAALENVPYHR